MRLGVPHRARRAERADRDGQSRGRGPRIQSVARRRRDDEPAPRKQSASPGTPARAAALRSDPEVARAQDAGGPVDRAAYGCPCGYQFSAPVSTTVSCPHCGTDQAW